MSIVKEIQKLYNFFEKNGIDVNVDFLELDSAEQTILQMSEFNNAVMKSSISSKEVYQLVDFLSGRKDNVASYVMDILLTNPSFLQHEEVKKAFHREIEEKIFEDIDDFNLSGSKLKIIDCFLHRDYKGIKPLLESLDEEDKVDVLMYIIEHTYFDEALDAKTEIGAILSEYSELIDAIYDESNLVNSGVDIEFEGDE